MTPYTKYCAIVFAALLSMSIANANAAVNATVDRSGIILGDTLKLVITATEGEELSAVKLQTLERDFQVLQRSNSSSTRIVNGRRADNKQLILIITPRREGRLTVPALRVGSGFTKPLTIIVAPAPEMEPGSEVVILEAEVDRQQVYVQGQLILTLRLMQSINLTDRSISELQLKDAFVKTLEQKSFQRDIDGRRWSVNELRFAIFPEHSGTLEIPIQTFTGRVREGRRDFFDLGGNGRLLRRNSEALSIDVQPRPDSYSGSTWLPATQLQLKEQWSTPPDQLRAGESATRTLTLLGEGVQGAQLPPVQLLPVEGLKFYPDQPDINDIETDSGLVASRVDSTAVVPTRAGAWTLPEIRIPWWDTNSNQLRYAVLPARDIAVAPADPSAIFAPLPGPPIAVEGSDSADLGVTNSNNVILWQAVAGVSSLGWLATLLFLWKTRRPRPTANTLPMAESTSTKAAWKHVIATCSDTDAAACRRAIITWANTRQPNTSITTVQGVAALFSDRTLEAELRAMEAHLYGDATAPWNGSRLRELLKGAKSKNDKGNKTASDRLELYPQ